MTTDDAIVANDFLLRYIADRAGGRPSGLEEYLRLFPRHHDLIRAEYAALVAGPEGEASDSGRRPEAESLRRIGPYAASREIGRGGQAVVYLATDTRNGATVALKVLRPGNTALLGEVLARFRREARLTATLEHPAICRILESGQDGPELYLAMAYVEGRSLDVLVRERAEGAAGGSDDGGDGSRPGPAPTARILDWFAEVADALHLAHRAGILHRDVKPGNIVVTPDQRPVILDFGLAREEAGQGSKVTGTGDWVGTPAYMSPEQVRGDPVDHRTDIYSLGVTLWETLAGRRPFEAASREALFRRILTAEVPDIRRAVPGLGPGLAAVIATAAAKEPWRRYEDAALLAADLRNARDGRPVGVRPVPWAVRLLRAVRRRPAAAALMLVLAFGVPALALIAGRIQGRWPEIRLGIEQRRADARERRLLDAYMRLLDHRKPPAAEGFGAILDELRDEGAPAAVEAVAGLALAHLGEGRPGEAGALLGAHAELARAHPALDAIAREAARAPAPGPETGLPARPECPETDHFLLGMLDLVRGHASQDARDFARAHERFTLAAFHSGAARRIHGFALAHAAGHRDDAGASRAVTSRLHALWPEDADRRAWEAFALRRADPVRSIALVADTIADRDECRHLADAARAESCHRAAARILGRAIMLAGRAAAADRLPDLVRAARSAALAGCGSGADAPAGAGERRALRDEALGWLRTALDLAASGTPPGSAPATRLWRDEPEFAGVRSAAGGVFQDAGEAASWEDLWRRAAAR